MGISIECTIAESYELQVRGLLAGECCAMANASRIVEYIERGSIAMTSYPSSLVIRNG